jgi:chromosome partitioning protein
LKIITIGNRKGGVGKTTTAYNLGYTYALAGKRVLFLDLDSQANLSSLCGVSPLSLEDFKAARVIGVNNLISILPATKRLSALENEIQGMFDRNVYLRDEILPKLPDADYLIIDTPPAIGILNINAFMISDAVHIVVNADSFSISGLVEMREIIDNVKTLNPKLKTRIVLNASFKGRTFTDAAREILAKEADYSGVEIPHRQHIIDCNARKVPALDAMDILGPFNLLSTAV